MSVPQSIEAAMMPQMASSESIDIREMIQPKKLPDDD
jgi:hypothetical protein